MFTVITDDPVESGVYCQWKHFEKKDSLTRMVAPLAQNSFDFQHITLADGDGTASALLLSGGMLYQSPRAGKIYEPAADLEGEVNITLASKISNNALLYDEAGHRFAFYYNTSDGLGVKKYDPLYLGTGYQYASAWTSVYAYALAKNDTRCFVYEFNPRGFNYSDNASFNGYYTINIPQGLDESAVFASTPPYSGLLFYASGNKVYRVDLNSFVPLETKIYEYPDPSSRITKMKFRHERIAEMSLDWGSMSLTMEDQPYWLGLAIEHADKTASLVEMRLKPSGEVLKEDGNQKVYEYKGFEGIVDIGYSFHPTN